jgi:diadenosine tetraphosphate (Ap4A) HIT family hydrolase
VAALEVSTLCLLKNQGYKGNCILIYDVEHVTSPDQLSEDEWAQFTRDLYTAVRALKSVCRPDHINVASLGNEIPHLHWHVIPRYKTDPRWGGPIWTIKREKLHHAEMPEKERAELITELRGFLGNQGA